MFFYRERLKTGVKSRSTRKEVLKMIEIDSASILKKEPLKIRFSGDIFGSVGLTRKVEKGAFVVCDRGVALEIKDEVKTRSFVSDGFHWFQFKALDLGSWADRVGPSEAIIRQAATKNPDLVCKGWPDVLLEGRLRHDMKRAKRPFVEFSDPDPCIGILWEVYPALKRLGVYIGRDPIGRGGYVRFFDFKEFKVL